MVYNPNPYMKLFLKFKINCSIKKDTQQDKKIIVYARKHMEDTHSFFACFIKRKPIIQQEKVICAM